MGARVGSARVRGTVGGSSWTDGSPQRPKNRLPARCCKGGKCADALCFALRVSGLRMMRLCWGEGGPLEGSL